MAGWSGTEEFFSRYRKPLHGTRACVRVVSGPAAAAALL